MFCAPGVATAVSVYCERGQFAVVYDTLLIWSYYNTTF